MYIYLFFFFWGGETLLNDNKEFFKGKPKEQKKQKSRRTTEKMRSTKFWKLKGSQLIRWGEIASIAQRNSNLRIAEEMLGKD